VFFLIWPSVYLLIQNTSGNNTSSIVVQKEGDDVHLKCLNTGLLGQYQLFEAIDPNKIRR